MSSFRWPTDGAPLETFQIKSYAIVSQLKHNDCQYGTYRSDHWQKWELEVRVSEDLAGLGRSLIREADQHNWPETLQAKSGWSDEGTGGRRSAAESDLNS